MFMLETVKHVTITYNFGDLADWISAFATFLAVIVSLYLANRRDLPKIHFSVLKKDNSIRITNKSYQIVELMLKTDDDKNYIKIALPPLKVDNPNMRDEEPFNHDMIVMHVTNSKKKIHKIRGYDLITKAHYHALFYFKNGKWQIKQYKLFSLRNVCPIGGVYMIGFRKIYGANWLQQVHTKTIVEDGKIRVEPLGKLPIHWNDVRNILLNKS